MYGSLWFGNIFEERKLTWWPCEIWHKDNYIHITYKNIMSTIRYNMATMRHFGVTFENLTRAHDPKWTRITCRFYILNNWTSPTGKQVGRWSVLGPCLCTCLEGHHDYYAGVQTRNLFTRIRGRKTAVIVPSVYAMGSRRIRGSIPVTGSGVPRGGLSEIIPKALQNRAKLNPIVKTVKNCWI